MRSGANGLDTIRPYPDPYSDFDGYGYSDTDTSGYGYGYDYSLCGYGYGYGNDFMKVKRFLNAVMQETLAPIRLRREEFAKDIPAVWEMLKKGSEEARAVAAQTLAEVKAAMKINYFEVEIIKRLLCKEKTDPRRSFFLLKKKNRRNRLEKAGKN